MSSNELRSHCMDSSPGEGHHAASPLTLLDVFLKSIKSPRTIHSPHTTAPEVARGLMELSCLRGQGWAVSASVRGAFRGHLRSQDLKLTAVMGLWDAVRSYTSLTCRSRQAESFTLQGRARKLTVKLTAIVISVEWCIISSVIASTAFIRVCAQYVIM